MVNKKQEMRRCIEIRVRIIDGVSKLAIYNTGRGMNRDDLVRATNLSCSVRKAQGLDGDENRGEGAKVAALPHNKTGMIFRSCRRGTVSEVTLRCVNGNYVRNRYEVVFSDGSVGHSSILDVSEEAARDGYDLSIDWTEVTVLGNDLSQDTTRFPYGEHVSRGNMRTVMDEIIDRFYAFAPNVEVRVQRHFHGRKDLLILRPFAESFLRHERDQEQLDARIRREQVQTADGILIEYVYLPALSGDSNVIGVYELGGGPTRGAIVWRRECYDVHLQRPRWSRVAAQYGLPRVHNTVSVFVHLPDHYPVRAGPYRVSLECTQTREPVLLEHFQALIRDHQPRWLGDLVAQELRPTFAVDMTQIEAELATRLRKLQVSVAHSIKMAPNPTDIPSNRNHSAERVSKDRRKKKVRPDNNQSLSTDSCSSQAKKRGHDLPQAPTRSAASPKILFLDSPEQVESEHLTERAARYVEGPALLLVNGLHQSIAGKIEELEAHFQATHDVDRFRDEIVAAVRVQMALLIGIAVVTALAKSTLLTWGDEQVRAALSPESLTLAAEANEMMLPVLRQRLAQRFHHLRRI